MKKNPLKPALMEHRAGAVKHVAACFFISLVTSIPAFAQETAMNELIEGLQPMAGHSFTAHAQDPEGSWRFVPADDEALSIEGRVDREDPASPVFIWQGTAVRTRFTGTKIGLRFEGARDRNIYNVIIDGKASILRLENGLEYDYVLDTALEDGPHELLLVKRSEAMYGEARFKGLLIDGDARIGPRTEPLPLKIEFYGDSITAGACNEIPDGNDDYDDLAEHNNWNSYGAITARRLNAEYANISYSGIGLRYSWHPLLLPEVWDRLYPRADSPVHRFDERKPDIVVLNLGQNDQGYPDSIKKPFPADFKDGYVELVQAMRLRYPQAWIVCATGGMGAIQTSRALNSALLKAQKELAGDSKILFMKFKAFTWNHPRVDTHEKMAAELEAFIREKIPLF